MRITALLPILCALSLNAQTSLVATEHVPVPGQEFAVNTGPYVVPGSGGANQTWDFSAITATGVDTVFFVDPTTSPNGADFPNVTVAAFDGDQSYTYYQATASEFLFVGNDDGNISFPMSDPSKFWPFPCNYQDSWTDLLGGTIVVQGQTVTRAGSVSGIADGHGTLLLPFGPVEDVLRVVVDEDYQDALILGTATHSVVTHYFFKRFLPFPVLQLTDRSLNVNGSITTSQSAQWVDSAAVGILEDLFRPLSVNVFPIPASGSTTVSFEASGDVDLSVVDLAGRTVRTEHFTGLRSGMNTKAIDLGGLAGGSYTVVVSCDDGARGSRRLIVD